MSTYGKVGWDVGIVGRWFRLVAGILIMVAVLWDFLGGNHTHPLLMNALIGLFFIGIVFAYLALYLLVAERLRGKSPWLPTVIFVLPAIYFSTINAFLVPYELSFGHLIGLPYVNHPITIAMLMYIGISFPVQFITKYGGCEVVAIQNLIWKKECTSYCVPLLPLDIAEKAIVDGMARRRENRSAA